MPPIDHRYPLLRTWLFGPGADSPAHEAMSASRADVLIQDLEDFTPPPRRDEARSMTAALFARWRAVGARVCVRINSLHEDGPLDISRVVPAKPDFIAYPKAATASEMRELVVITQRSERMSVQSQLVAQYVDSDRSRKTIDD